jgi:molybdate transport repressor ModE-like protein
MNIEFTVLEQPGVATTSTSSTKITTSDINILRGVRDHGSLSACGRELSLSYRHVWKTIDKLNQQLVSPVVSTTIGGDDGGGTELTQYGHEVVRLHDEALKAVTTTQEMQSFLQLLGHK